MFRRTALRLHLLHERAYTWWKVRESGVRPAQPLTYLERRFYLQFRPALQGEDLVIYDVGASKGVFTTCVAKLPNVTAVHAFEPIKMSYGELLANTRSYSHVVCHNVALGDTDMTQQMYVIDDREARDSSSLLRMEQRHKTEIPQRRYDAHQELVRVVRMDEYVAEHGLPLPHLVKVDVQGFEDRVLRGGQKTISVARFCCLEMSLVSLYEGSLLFDDLYAYMRSLKFELTGIVGTLVGRAGRQVQVDGLFERREGGPR